MTFPWFNVYAYAVLCEDLFYHHQDDAGKVMTHLTDIFSSLATLSSTSSSMTLPHTTTIATGSYEDYFVQYVQNTLRHEPISIHKRLQDIGIIERIPSSELPFSPSTIVSTIPPTVSTTPSSASVQPSTISSSSSNASAVPAHTYTVQFRWRSITSFVPSESSSSSVLPSLNVLITICEKIKNRIRSTLHQMYFVEKQYLLTNAIRIATQQRNTVGTLVENTQVFTRARHRIQSTYDILYQLFCMVHPSHVQTRIQSSRNNNNKNNTPYYPDSKRTISSNDTGITTRDGGHVDKKIKNSPFSSIQRIFTSSTSSSVASSYSSTAAVTAASSSSVLRQRSNNSSTTNTTEMHPSTIGTTAAMINTSVDTVTNVLSNSVPTSSVILPSELVPAPILACTVQDTLLNSHPLFSFLYVFFAAQLEVSQISPHVRMGVNIEDSVFLEAVPNMDIARIFIPSIVYFLVLTLGCSCTQSKESESMMDAAVSTSSHYLADGETSFRIFPVGVPENSTDPSVVSIYQSFVMFADGRTELTNTLLMDQYTQIETILKLRVNISSSSSSSLNSRHRWELPSDISNRLISALLFDSSLFSSSSLLKSLVAGSSSSTHKGSWSLFSSNQPLPLLLPPLALEYRIPMFPSSLGSSSNSSTVSLNSSSTEISSSVPVPYVPLTEETNSFKMSVWQRVWTPSSSPSSSSSVVSSPSIGSKVYTPNISHGSYNASVGTTAEVSSSSFVGNKKYRSNNPTKNRMDCVTPGQWYYIDDIRTNIDGAMDT